VVATNQAGIGRGMIDMAAVNAVHAHMNQQLMEQGARVDACSSARTHPKSNAIAASPSRG
jgi:D-glycero-D-manno-heptose 1,7-bisphosphate phosphatase